MPNVTITPPPPIVVQIKGGKTTAVSSPTGGATRLVELSDVDATPLANGDVLTYISANGKFEFHTGGSGASGNAFGIVNIAGQNNVIADTSSDTLQLIAGTGILLTTDNVNSSITIVATGGSATDQFARDQANTAFNKANTANVTGQAAFDRANSAYSNANTAIYTAAQIRANISNTAPVNYDSSTGIISHALSAVTPTTYGNTNFVPTITVDDKGHLTSVTNTAIALDAAAITTGTLVVARGGTGQTSYSNGDLLIGNTASGGLDRANLTQGTGISILNANGKITISAAVGVTYYLENGSLPDVGVYHKALTAPSTLTENTISFGATGTLAFTLLSSFITTAGNPGVTLLPPGTYGRHIHATTGAANQVGRLRVELYKYAANGLETLLRTADSPDFALDNETPLLTWNVTDPVGYDLATTDRLLFKLYAARVAGPPTTNISIFTQGTNRASYMSTTIIGDSGSLVTSVAGRTGAVVLNTNDVTENAAGPYYFTAAKVRANISNTAPVYYNNATGVVSFVPATANGQTLIGNTVSGSFDVASLTQGTGILITNDKGSITIAATGGASANGFGIVAVAGQSNVVAHQANDVFNLVQGTGILLTTDITTNSVTITATGGSAIDQFARDNSNGAFAKANTANTTADAAFAKANTANVTGQAAFDHANGAFTKANTATVTGQAAFDKANTAIYTAAQIRANISNAYPVYYNATTGVVSFVPATANGQTLIGNTVSGTFDVNTIAQTAPVIVVNDKGTITLSHASSGVVATGYGVLNQIPVLVVDAFGHITAVTNTAIGSLDAGVITTGTLVVARGGTGQSTYTNGQILIGNTGSTGLDKATIAQSAPIIITNLQGSITVSHARSGVTAVDSYGSGAIIPVFAVDANGHLTAVVNTAIAGLATGVLTTGILPVVRGGTGLDATGIVNGSIHVGNTVNVGFDTTTIAQTAPVIVVNGKGTITLSHASSGVVATGYGTAAIVPKIVVDDKGHITSVTNTGIAIDASAITSGILLVDRGGTGQGLTYANGQLLIGNTLSGGLDKSTIAQSAPIIITNLQGSITVSHARSGVVAVDSYGSGAIIPVIAVDANGHITAAVNTAVAISAAAITSGTLVQGRGGTGFTGATANGQTLIGNTVSGGFDLATLTAGTGININNLKGSIEIVATGGSGADQYARNIANNETAWVYSDTAANGVYTDWATLYAAYQAAGSPVATIGFTGDPAIIPTGTYAFTPPTFFSGLRDSDYGLQTTVTFDTGAKISGVAGYRGLMLQNQGTQFVQDISLEFGATIDLHNTSVLAATGKEFFYANSGTVILTNSTLDANTVNVDTYLGFSILVRGGVGSALLGNAIIGGAGTAATTLTIDRDTNAFVLGSQLLFNGPIHTIDQTGLQGATGARPTFPANGQIYYDYTVGGPVVANNGAWKTVNQLLQSTANGQTLIGNTVSGGFDVATLTQGTGIAITNDKGSIIITATGGSAFDQFARDNSNGAFTKANGAVQTGFVTINVAGQANVVSDSNTDVLTLVAGSGVTITTDAALDSITISSTGGTDQYARNLANSGTSFIYANTNSTVNGVYTTWSSLYDAYVAAGSPVTTIHFYLRDQDANNQLEIPSGYYPFSLGTRFEGMVGRYVGTSAVNFNNGARISGIGEFKNLQLVADSLDPVMYLSNFDDPVTGKETGVDFVTLDGATILSYNTAPFFFANTENCGILCLNEVKGGTGGGGYGLVNLKSNVVSFDIYVYGGSAIFQADSFASTSTSAKVKITRRAGTVSVAATQTNYAGVVKYVDISERIGGTRPVPAENGASFYDTALDTPAWHHTGIWTALRDYFSNTTPILYDNLTGIISLTTVPVAQGGTGQTAYTNGQILIGNTGSTGLDTATIAQSAPIIITNLQGSITVSHARSGVVALDSYGSQAIIPVMAVDANGHLTAVVNTAIGGLGTGVLTTGILSVARGGAGLDATGIVNGSIHVGNTVNVGFDTTTIAQTAPVIVVNGKGTITLSHASSGVVATGYGTATQIPALVVDAFGHVTAVVNTAIAGLDAGVITTGTLVVARGGTGQTTYTNGQILIGNTGSTGLDKALIAQSAPVIVTVAQGSITLSHARSGVVAASYGSGTLIPVITVDDNGHITVATTAAAAGGSGISLGLSYSVSQGFAMQ